MCCVKRPTFGISAENETMQTIESIWMSHINLLLWQCKRNFMKSVPDTKFHAIRVVGHFHDVYILFMSLFFSANEKKELLSFQMENHSNFVAEFALIFCWSVSFLLLFRSAFYFAHQIPSNYEFKGCTKRSVTINIELIYMVWLVFDSVKHDDAAIFWR